MLAKIMKKFRSLKLRVKLIVIALVLIFAFGLTTWRNSQCTIDIDRIPIQIVRSFQYDDVTSLSEAQNNTPIIAYKFMTAVTEHLAAKLAQEKLCLTSPESVERSLLQFENPRLSVTPLPVSPLKSSPHSVCRVTSPWLDLVVERKPVPSVRAIVRFSARQLLTDQAALSGAANVPPGVPMPLTNEELRQYAFEYVSSEIYHKPSEKPIEERVPAYLLWVFRRADHSHISSFPSAASGSASEAMRIRSDQYAQIIIALIDQCFETGGANLQYDSILDIADLVSIDEYKIETPIIVLTE